MLDSTGIGIGILVLAAIGLAFVNPVLVLIPFALAGAPLAFVGVARMWQHAAPSANVEGGPSVPSTREASYDPRTVH